MTVTGQAPRKTVGPRWRWRYQASVSHVPEVAGIGLAPGRGRDDQEQSRLLLTATRRQRATLEHCDDPLEVPRSGKLRGPLRPP